MIILYWVSLSHTTMFYKSKTLFRCSWRSNFDYQIYSESDVRLHTVSVHQTGSQTFKEYNHLRLKDCYFLFPKISPNFFEQGIFERNCHTEQVSPCTSPNKFLQTIHSDKGVCICEPQKGMKWPSHYCKQILEYIQSAHCASVSHDSRLLTTAVL